MACLANLCAPGELLAALEAINYTNYAIGFHALCCCAIRLCIFCIYAD